MNEMSHFRLFGYLFYLTIISMLFFFFFFFLILNTKVSNLFSFFPVIDIPVMARGLFICSSFFFSLTGRTKLHWLSSSRRAFLTFLIVNIFKVRFFYFLVDIY